MLNTMDDQLVINQYASLPEQLKAQVADFIAFLKYKHEEAQRDDLDEATRKLLDDRVKDFQANRDKAIPVKEYLESVKQRYQ